jgi:hypothetical protein
LSKIIFYDIDKADVDESLFCPYVKDYPQNVEYKIREVK